jgi:CspA family cold shock protein
MLLTFQIEEHRMSKDKHQRDRQKPRVDLKRLRADIGKAKPAPQKPVGQKPPEPISAAAQKAEAAIAQVAADIAARLGETEEEPRVQLERVVRYLGAEHALALAQETLDIEAGGGMMLRDGSRRHTPGGVFFRLVRERAAKTQYLSIFYPEYEQVFPLSAEELTERLADAAHWPRASAQSFSFSLTGRPAAIAPPDTSPLAPYVIFELTSATPELAFTKGLPPVTEPTVFRVLAPTRQWPRIAQALLDNPEAQVLVSGFPAIDPRTPGAITLYATFMNVFRQPGSGPAEKSAKGKGKAARGQAPHEVVTGSVKWFSAEKGFGFLIADKGGDVFVHQTALGAGRTSLAAGERVYFGVRQGNKGPEAVNVHLGALPGPAQPTLRLDVPAIPASIRMRVDGRPSEFEFLGRPGEPPSLIGYLIEADPPKFPDGSPAPTAPTTFLVLISLKQWKFVRDVLKADPADALVVHGHCALDLRVPTMPLIRTTHLHTLTQWQSQRERDRAATHARHVATVASEQAPMELEAEADNG